MMMNEILFIRTATDEFTEQLIMFCKPFMMSQEHKKDVGNLLNSESNLRMTLELAGEFVDKDDLLKKMILSSEEIKIISNLMNKFEKSEDLKVKAQEIELLIDNLIIKIKNL